MSGFQRILVATDGSTVCDGAVERAIELSSCLDAELVVLSVARRGEVAPADLDSASDPLGMAEEATMALTHRGPTTEAELAMARAQAASARGAAAGCRTRPIVWEGPTADSILAAAAAEGADLIVVGSHCRGGVGRLLLGSVSDHVVRHATIPVMVVRPTSGPEPAAAG